MLDDPDLPESTLNVGHQPCCEGTTLLLWDTTVVTGIPSFLCADENAGDWLVTIYADS